MDLNERIALATEIIGAPHESTAVPTINRGPIFAGRFPAGFAPISRVAEGDRFDYNPDQIADISANLTDSDYRRVCAAIRSYQWLTYINFSVGLSPETIEAAFAADDPESYRILHHMADSIRMPLPRFLGLER